MRFNRVTSKGVPGRDDAITSSLGKTVVGQFDDALGSSNQIKGEDCFAGNILPSIQACSHNDPDFFIFNSNTADTIPKSECEQSERREKLPTHIVSRESSPSHETGTKEDVVKSICDFTEADVLCGRGGGTNNHAGNKYFRKLVEEHRDQYFLAKKLEKAQISRKIVAIIRDRGGRYLRRDESTRKWCDIGDKQATLKTSQALREGLEVKKRQAFLVAQNIASVTNTSTSRSSFVPEYAPRYHIHPVDITNGQAYKRQRIAEPHS
eukprot:CAMPEP_0197433104 /NCGR_PEP_ID=MMETSP1175-20131217/1035_1 /TAXON_ID=1003142 /ORGANISM="Triceratium dubium, Strain CCMP147" /LENGTH=264 /DNA_ID=CAMNT_0042961375 /DNA_START=193 /DNA_END=987 /DNA_ORIENTATION=+